MITETSFPLSVKLIFLRQPYFIKEHPGDYIIYDSNKYPYRSRLSSHIAL